jgi:uncharacterized protein YegL
LTNQNYTHYLLVIDRSGSMYDIATDAEGGIRQFAKEQARLHGKATLSLYDFGSSVDKQFDFVPVSHADAYMMIPRGMTRLYDAIGLALTETGQRLADLEEDERPGKVIVLIVTDGCENDSKEYDLHQVRDMITHQHDVYGWEFSYIGANVDTFAESTSMGIGSHFSYDSNSESTRAAYASVSVASASYRMGDSDSITYS